MLELNFNGVWVAFYPNGQMIIFKGDILPKELESLIDQDCTVSTDNCGNTAYWLKEECYIIPQEA